MRGLICKVASGKVRGRVELRRTHFLLRDFLTLLLFLSPLYSVCLSFSNCLLLSEYILDQLVG